MNSCHVSVSIFIHSIREAARAAEGRAPRRARTDGGSSASFAAKLTVVLSPTPWRNELDWVAFGGTYDFTYMVKILTGGRPLPETWHEFIWRRQKADRQSHDQVISSNQRK